MAGLYCELARQRSRRTVIQILSDRCTISYQSVRKSSNCWKSCRYKSIFVRVSNFSSIIPHAFLQACAFCICQSGGWTKQTLTLHAFCLYCCHFRPSFESTTDFPKKIIFHIPLCILSIVQECYHWCQKVPRSVLLTHCWPLLMNLLEEYARLSLNIISFRDALQAKGTGNLGESCFTVWLAK